MRWYGDECNPVFMLHNGMTPDPGRCKLSIKSCEPRPTDSLKQVIAVVGQNQD